jgi:hypothetical protein
MSRRTTVTHEFVEFVPERPKDGVVYVSIPYATAVHLCSCGCGTEVATPLSPADWQLTYDGETVTLHPSIGNWSLPCQSHYWVRNDRIVWARRWTAEEIAAGRADDRMATEERFGQRSNRTGEPERQNVPLGASSLRPEAFWPRLRRWFLR